MIYQNYVFYKIWIQYFTSIFDLRLLGDKGPENVMIIWSHKKYSSSGIETLQWYKGKNLFVSSERFPCEMVVFGYTTYVFQISDFHSRWKVVFFCPSFQQDTFQGKYKTVVLTEDLHHFPLGERRLREWERRFSLTNAYHCNVDCLKKWQENQDS